MRSVGEGGAERGNIERRETERSASRNGSGGSGGSKCDNGGQTSKKKKTRTTFTGHQIFELEKQFELKKYLSSSERAEIAIQLKVTETQVQIFC